MGVFRQAFTFDDVLLVPKFSTVRKRADVDTSADLGKGVKLGIPLLSANMKSVTEAAMARAVAGLGGLGLLHRFASVPDQVMMWRECRDAKLVGASVGGRKEEYERADALVSEGCRVLCVDVAHGDSVVCQEMVGYLAKNYPGVLVIAGNVATGEGAVRLWQAGADVVKVGIGPGSLCTTRIETGNGVPQLSALMEVHEARRKAGADFRIVTDGGIKNAGDIVKALCYSEAVMLGNLLAGTDEAPGEVIALNGVQYKRYEGSSTHKANHIEGVAALVPYKGPVAKVVTMLIEGVRSGCSYQGAKALGELQRDPRFVLMSQAGLVESHPHNVLVHAPAKNGF
jgi:IMP dehydrogenase